MSDKKNGRQIVRRIAALVAGLLTTIVLSTLTDMVLHATGVYPPLRSDWSRLPMSDALFLLATGYRTLYVVLAGYITARLAPARPLAHALALGAIGTVLAIGGALAMWGVGPAWYPIALIVLAIPSTVTGGALALRQSSLRCAEMLAQVAN